LESGALYCAGGIPFAVISFYPFINPTSATFSTAFDIVSDPAVHERLTDGDSSRPFQTPTGAILGQLVVSYTCSSSTFLLAPLITRDQGIAPTIIAVRVGLGTSVDSVDSFSLTATRPAARRPLEFHPNVSAANSIEDRILYLRPESEQDCTNKAEP
jgi:hypothetical protein